MLLRHETSSGTAPTSPQHPCRQRPSDRRTECRLARSKRATAARNTEGDRGRWSRSHSCTACVTASCRSASNRINSMASRSSPGCPISIAVIARRRLDRSGSRTGQRDGAIPPDSSKHRSRSRAVLSRWNNSVSSAMVSASSKANEPRWAVHQDRPAFGPPASTAPVALPRCEADAISRTPAVRTGLAAAPANRHPATPARSCSSVRGRSRAHRN